jgi:hypothetical protein
MESMRSTWTDSRLDDLNDRVSELSERVTEMDTRLTGRIDSLQQMMAQGFVAIMIAISTCFVGLAGLIVAKL